MKGQEEEPWGQYKTNAALFGEFPSNVPGYHHQSLSPPSFPQ
jgi:hypothetical protein